MPNVWRLFNFRLKKLNIFQLKKFFLLKVIKALPRSIECKMLIKRNAADFFLSRSHVLQKSKQAVTNDYLNRFRFTLVERKNKFQYIYIYVCFCIDKCPNLSTSKLKSHLMMSKQKNGNEKEQKKIQIFSWSNNNCWMCLGAVMFDWMVASAVDI